MLTKHYLWAKNHIALSALVVRNTGQYPHTCTYPHNRLCTCAHTCIHSMYTCINKQTHVVLHTCTCMHIHTNTHKQTHLQFARCHMRWNYRSEGKLYCCCSSPSCNKVLPKNGSYSYLLHQPSPHYRWITPPRQTSLSLPPTIPPPTNASTIHTTMTNGR